MNGRIYDPNLGRFLSADPIIQAPYNSQSYNRYSYVMNNPLSMIDPSGYSWLSKKWKSVKKFAKKNWSAVKFVATAYVFGPNAAVLTNKSFRGYVKTHKWSQQVASIGAGIADAIGCAGACSSATSAYLTELNGGDFGDIMKSAAMAYASYAAFSAVNAPYGGNWEVSRVIANGVTGGAVSMAYGGKFGDGAALSGGLAFGAYLYTNTVNWYKSTAGHQIEGSSEATWKPGTEAYSKADGVSVRNVNHINIGMGVKGDGSPINRIAFSNLAAEGGFVSQATNQISGFNSFSVVHDIWGGVLQPASPLLWNLGITNFGSMPPALLVNYSALLAQQPHTVTSYQFDIRKQYN